MKSAGCKETVEHSSRIRQRCLWPRSVPTWAPPHYAYVHVVVGSSANSITLSKTFAEDTALATGAEGWRLGWGTWYNLQFNAKNIKFIDSDRFTGPVLNWPGEAIKNVQGFWYLGSEWPVETGKHGSGNQGTGKCRMTEVEEAHWNPLQQ